MTLLIGTRDGVFRSTSRTLDDVEKVLDSGSTLRVRTFENHEGVFAARRTGLYRSVDDVGEPRCATQGGLLGRWKPRRDSPLRRHHPAHLYVSTDGGETWSERRDSLGIVRRNLQYDVHVLVLGADE